MSNFRRRVLERLVYLSMKKGFKSYDLKCIACDLDFDCNLNINDVEDALHELSDQGVIHITIKGGLGAVLNSDYADDLIGA